MNVEGTKMSHDISIDVNDMSFINNSSNSRLSLVVNGRILVQIEVLSRFGGVFVGKNRTSNFMSFPLN